MYYEIEKSILESEELSYIVGASLIYDNTLIEKIFHDKLTLYTIIKENLFDEYDDYIEYLLELDNNELQNYLDNIVEEAVRKTNV